MKKTFPLLLVALLLAAHILGQEPTALPSKQVADRIWAEFESAVWDTPYEEWRSHHPGSTCQQFDGGESTWSNTEGGIWSYRCEVNTETQKAQWTFYVLSSDEPLVCRLEHFHAIASGISKDTEIYAALQSQLQSRFGPGEPVAASLGEWGSAYWRGVRRWQTPELQIYLYLKDYPSEPPSLGLLARHRHLLEAMAENSRLQEFERQGWQAGSGASLSQELAQALLPAFPNLPALLAEDLANQLTPAKQAVLDQTLQGLLQQAKTAAPDRRPLLLLAADRVAARLEFPRPDASTIHPAKKEFAGYELDYQWDELGATWAYRHNLLWRVWEEYGKTAWGERAFVMLLYHGWHTGAGCGSDQFREVINHGRQFLQERPTSAYRLDVTLAVAQAYETWWSLSQASQQDMYVDRTTYEAGSAEARQRAIDYYQTVLELTRDGREASYAREHLPLLKLGLDTSQRRFFCIYD
ncbi:MAG: hypothetical protein ABSG54_18495 [Terriglobia bacterium]|jgi:hypothetical protein